MSKQNALNHAALVLLFPVWPAREVGRQGLATRPGDSGAGAIARNVRANSVFEQTAEFSAGALG